VKIDFKKTNDGYQATRNVFRILDVPASNYLMIDGEGDPNVSPDFASSIQTLYPLSYALKFASKNRADRDYVVPPLEALWWSTDPTAFTSARDKSQWQWTLMMMVPEWIEREWLDEARVSAAKKADALALSNVRYEKLEEGTCVQVLHVGSFDDEAPVLAQLHDVFIPEQHLEMTGKHHEIYFSDFRRVPPERCRTILRQPVRRLV